MTRSGITRAHSNPPPLSAMNMLNRVGAAAALGFTLIAAPAAWAGPAFSKVVVFGDSLSDTGNLYTLTGGGFPIAPVYYEGRQSNGPVWVEYVADRLGLANAIENYAVVGALTRPAPLVPTGNVWSSTFPGLDGTDVHSQVLQYLADAGGVADPAAVYVLQGGANDFNNVANPAVIVGNLVGTLATLEAAGAQHVMLVNLPDIGRTPRVILAEAMGILPPGTAAYLSSVCAQLNQALAANAAAVTPASVTLTMIDLYGFMNIITDDPADFGFDQPVLPYLYVNDGSDPATWVFWDDLHPTTRAHQLWAEDALNQVLVRYSPRVGDGGQGHGAINALRGLVTANGSH